MEIHKGYDLKGAAQDNFVLRLEKNLYGQKQVGRMWNKHLTKKLREIGFVQSQVDECMFYKQGYIYVLYTDDSVLTGPSTEEIDKIIKQMRSAGLELTVEGDMSDFLGV